MSITVPEDLTSLSDTDLSALADEIRTAAQDLETQAVTDDSALAEIEGLVLDFDRVEDEISARAIQVTDRANRASAALSRFKEDAPASPDAPVDALAPVAAAVEIPAELAVEAPAEASAVEVVAHLVEEVVNEILAEAVELTAEVTEAAEVAVEEISETVELTVEEAETAEVAVEEVETAEVAVEVIPETVELAVEVIVTEEELAETETLSVEAPVVEAAAPAVAVVVTSEDAVSHILSTSTDVAALDAALPDAMATRSETSEVSGILATNAVPGVNEGATLSVSDLAKAIVSKRTGFGRISAGTSERIVLGTAAVEFENEVGGSEESNFAILDGVRKGWASSRKVETALVASGGVCAPVESNYDFFRLAEALNPVESSLPVVAAPRGGIRFITPPDWTDGAGGVRVTTEAEDADGYTSKGGTTDPKPCVSVSCPPVEEARVDAVSQCVTFGNLNYRVFPEQVEAFLADLAVIFTQVKEVFYLDAIDAASTSVTFTPSYGATRGITYTLLAAAANYRRRHHMPTEATLTLQLPSWVIEFIKADLIADHAMGLGFIGAGAAEVNQVFASMNLDVSWYYDSATGAGQGYAGAQSAGVLNPFPYTVVAYLYAPGTFVRLNAGTLDLGVVRDSVLNSTNDLQLFSEEWIQVVQVGLESLRLEITLCPDGTGPEPVVPMDCAALSA